MAITGPLTPEAHPSSFRLPRPLWIAVAAIVLVLGVLATASMWQSLNGPPFQMVVEPDDDHATVRFIDTGKGLASDSFRIDRRIGERQVVVLDSDSVTIPGGQIEFADTTLMPGRFTIRIGQTIFDVMPSRIDVDGKHFWWRDRDALR
jgi:hypothetical protein